MAREYEVDVRIEPVPQRFARWVSRTNGAKVDVLELQRAQIGLVAVDVRGRPVVLFEGDWGLRTAERFHPEFLFAETAVGVVVRGD